MRIEFLDHPRNIARKNVEKFQIKRFAENGKTGLTNHCAKIIILHENFCYRHIRHKNFALIFFWIFNILPRQFDDNLCRRAKLMLYDIKSYVLF